VLFPGDTGPETALSFWTAAPRLTGEPTCGSSPHPRRRPGAQCRCVAAALHPAPRSPASPRDSQQLRQPRRKATLAVYIQPKPGTSRAVIAGSPACPEPRSTSRSLPVAPTRCKSVESGPSSFQWCPATGQGAMGTN